MMRCLSTRLYIEALVRHRVAAAIEHDRVFREMQLRTIVDIGANRGQFSLAARRHFPSAKLVSFEPLEEPACVYAGVFAGDALVTIHKSAIGSVRDKATIHVSGRDDSSSLLPIGKLQNEIFPGTAQKGIETVHVAPLHDFLGDDEIEAPAFLKIDVQGYELKTLQGCERLLDQFDFVYVECSLAELYLGQALADEVIAWLRDRGFALKGMYNPAVDWSGCVIQADFLFARTGGATESATSGKITAHD